MKRTAQIIMPLIALLVFSCSTTVQILNPQELKGKKVGVQLLNVSNLNLPKKSKTGTDTLCSCISQSATNAIYPFLQQSGFIAVPLNLSPKANILEAVEKADSLQLDYVLSGTGIIRFTGTDPFMEQLTIKLISVKTGDIKLSGYFTGSPVRSIPAMERIGKKIVKKMNDASAH